MRLLVFTNLYPNAVQPRHGIFVEHRVRRLAEAGANVRVVSPVPWVPDWPAIVGEYAVLARVAARDERHGLQIWHPRYLAIPKLTSWLNPWSMALGARAAIDRLVRQGGDFDLIDAHFVYPDGAAAILLGSWYGKPVTVTARGTDINQFPRFRVPRAWIGWVTRNADAMITVSSALREAVLKLGVPPEKVTELRNGVDLELFQPLDRELVRRELGLTRPTLLSAGHLVADKGHQFVIEALKELPDADLIVIGDGPLRAKLHELAVRCGVAARVTWTGTLPQCTLAKYYAASDVTVLASKMEGMANVLLESLACGTPVIATAVGGNAEIVSTPSAGVLMEARSAAGVVKAYRTLMRSRPCTAAVRLHAEQFAWGPTIDAQLRLFEAILAKRTRGPGFIDDPPRASG
jgi:teichuronic acid biosynthesis glycosyltransferase TuaC